MPRSFGSTFFRLVCHCARSTSQELGVAEANGSMWTDEGLVFPGITGTKWDISNFGNVFQVACRDAGIGHWRPHELRHSAASWLFANNVHIKVISDQMGHAQISTTADIYGHLIRQPAEVTNAIAKIRSAAS